MQKPRDNPDVVFFSSFLSYHMISYSKENQPKQLDPDHLKTAASADHMVTQLLTWQRRCSLEPLSLRASTSWRSFFWGVQRSGWMNGWINERLVLSSFQWELCYLVPSVMQAIEDGRNWEQRLDHFVFQSSSNYGGQKYSVFLAQKGHVGTFFPSISSKRPNLVVRKLARLFSVISPTFL